jgi:hypothetical protein
MLKDWSNFFSGELGAAAALAGLIFVALSVNHSRMLQSNRMADRGLEALAMLLLVVVAASLGLVPGIGLRAFGVSIFIAAACVSAGIFILQRTYLAHIRHPHRKRSIQLAVCNQLAVVLIGLGGLLLLWTCESGLYLLPAGFLATFLCAMTNAWVLLIEINR